SYREAARLDTGLAVAPYGLGNVLYKQGTPAQAEEAYREALQRDPEYVSAHQNLGIALFDRQDYEGAAREFEEALRRDPRLAAAQHDLGLSLIRLGRSCEGLPHLQRSAALDRTFAGDDAVRAEIRRLESSCRQ